MTTPSRAWDARDHDLQARGLRRRRNFQLAALGLVTVFLVSQAAILIGMSDDPGRAARFLVPVVTGALVFIWGAVWLSRRLQRRGSRWLPASFRAAGLPAKDQRRLRRWVRRGELPDDPRERDLVLETADSVLRVRWLLWLHAVVLLLILPAALTSDGWARAMYFVIVPSMLMGAVDMCILRRGAVRVVSAGRRDPG